MFMTLNVDKKPMIPMISLAIDRIFNNPKDMFWTGRVLDVLFDGIPVDCSNTEDFQTKAVCGVFESGEVKAVQPHNDTHFKFSLFQAVSLFHNCRSLFLGFWSFFLSNKFIQNSVSKTNATDLGQFTVFRGKKNSADIGRVVAFNDEPEMDVWEGDECNQYVGTDSTIFAPYMDVNDGIWAHEPSICRSLGAVFLFFLLIFIRQTQIHCIIFKCLISRKSIMWANRNIWVSEQPNLPSILVAQRMR